MNRNATQSAYDSTADGHIGTTADMTDKPNESTVDETFNVFILLEHEFFVGAETGELDNLKDTYSHLPRALFCSFMAITTNQRFTPHLLSLKIILQ